MKIRNWVKSVPAVLLAAGIWVSPAYAIDIPLGDASFDDTDVNASTYTDYAYITSGHVTTWEDLDSLDPNSTAFGPWWYNFNYGAITSPGRPDPRTGTQALHGSGDYAWQTVPAGALFETGKSYTFSGYLGGDSGAGTNAWNAGDRSWLYIFHADTTPDLSTVFFDDDSLVGFGFNRDRTFFNSSVPAQRQAMGGRSAAETNGER